LENAVPIYAIGDREPLIDPTAFVHPDAVVIGSVEIGPESSVWPAAVLRGDSGDIVIGAQTSVQDGTVVHVTATASTRIGSRCVIGHLAHLEGCTVEDDALVGSGAVVLHRAVVRSTALVGAGAVVVNDMEVPSGAMALGVPATVKPDTVRPGAFDEAVANYVERGRQFRERLRRIG
jgi:carbonic anhydrase/acetyltransferase-like protein (isoleucine patch superfamily)